MGGGAAGQRLGPLHACISALRVQGRQLLHVGGGHICTAGGSDDDRGAGTCALAPPSSRVCMHAGGALTWRPAKLPRREVRRRHARPHEVQVARPQRADGAGGAAGHEAGAGLRRRPQHGQGHHLSTMVVVGRHLPGARRRLLSTQQRRCALGARASLAGAACGARVPLPQARAGWGRSCCTSRYLSLSQSLVWRCATGGGGDMRGADDCVCQCPAAGVAVGGTP